MKYTKSTIAGLLCCATVLSAGFMDNLGDIAKETAKESAKAYTGEAKATPSAQLPTATTQTSAAANSLSTGDMNGALKSALNMGVDYAIKTLGAKDGYMSNPLTKIGLPDDMQKAADLVKKVGGEKYVDDLVLALNNAATEAAPKTAKIFAKSISDMNIDDAKKILAGSDKAATDYFRASSTKELQNTIAPIIKKSMENNSVSKYYDSFQSFYKSNAGALKNEYVSGAANMLGYGSAVPSDKDTDLNSFVTNKSIDGLMLKIQEQEKGIRANPLMQNNDLVKKVFSAF
ncbi:MAG: DUF4197 domain-containing protein [Campylobacterales bacterium]|nr:DUF4197 domain-containing protein [Campylobacterales bacterium]